MSPILALTGLLAVAAAQQIGKTPEVHPKLPTQLCTTRHGCVTQQTSVVLDALTHSIQNIKTGASCENSTGFPDQTICPNAQACGRNCAIQGINDYSQHGVTVSGNSMTLHQYLNINGTETSVSPRVYLLAPGGQNYDLLKLLNQEFTFTVDVSNLPCGMNGALYLSEMSATGGRSSLNPAGAAYGTGYCDAQCPKSAWINGVANINDNGACCNEMDIWEANAVDTQFTPHACNVTGLYECSGASCSSSGVCDQIGCGYNSYAYGNKTFYGYNDIVNTNKVIQSWSSTYTQSRSLTPCPALHRSHAVPHKRWYRHRHT